MLLGQIRPIELQYVEGNEYRRAICCCLGRLLSGRREPILQHRKVRCAAVIRDGDLTIQQGYSGADIEKAPSRRRCSRQLKTDNGPFVARTLSEH